MKKRRFISTLLVAILLCSVTSIGIANGVNEVRTAQSLELYRMQELCDQTRLELYNEVDSYIKKYAPNSKLSADELVDQCMKYDFDICFALAQGHLESHFGTAGKARYTHSVWNVGSHKNHPYASEDESIEPYIILIKDKYVKPGKTELDLLHNFVSRSGYRYAASGYEPKLRSYVYKVKNTTNIDSLSQVLKQNEQFLILYSDSLNID